MQLNRAITRMQASILVVVIVAAVAAGAYFTIGPTAPTGPTGPTTQTGTTASSAPNANTIIYEAVGQPDTVDPATDYETNGANLIVNVYEPLVLYKGDHADEIVPWLAESFDVSSDGLTYTFHLRSGITFSDGTAFDATAVYFSLMRSMVIDDPEGPAWMLLQDVRGAANYSKQYNNAGPSAPGGYGDKYTSAELNEFLNAKPIEVLDPMTVAIHLERPYTGFLAILAYTPAFIVSPTAIKAHWTAPTDGTPYIEGITSGDYHGKLNPWPEQNMVGTGPYELRSWDKASTEQVLARNENYWGGPDKRGLAPVPNIVIRGVDDANTRLLDLKGGTADIVYVPPSSPLVFDYTDKGSWLSTGKLVSLSPDFQVFGPWPILATDYVGLNTRIRGLDGNPQAFQPFADIRIRKAVTLAFNRTAFVHDGLVGLGVEATQILPPGMLGYDPTILQSPYDPDTAKKLLIDAGTNPIKPDNAFSPAHPETIQLTYDLGNIPRETAVTILANSINNLASDTGLYASAVGMSWSQELSGARHGNLVYSQEWGLDYPDPDDFLVPFASGTAGVLAPRLSYNNPEVNKLVDEQASIQDTTQRLQVISDIEHKVNDDWTYVWLFYPTVVSVSRSWMHDRANSSIASGIASMNPVFGAQALYYFYEMEKGAQLSQPSAQITQPFLAEIQQLQYAPAQRKGFTKEVSPLNFLTGSGQDLLQKDICGTHDD